jgi:pre-rRNA-processing protein TSR3
MDPAFPITVIVRDRHENPKKCSIVPLRGRADLRICNYPLKRPLQLDHYVRLDPSGPELSAKDARTGLLLLDGSWRWVEPMIRTFADVPPRSLHGWQTAYPRVSKLGTDPGNGLASVEALFAAYHILGRPTAGLLDHYLWAEEFLQRNQLA